jgi:hypothetical protein
VEFTGINYYKLAVEKDRDRLFLRPYGNDINEEIKREPTRLFLKWNPGGIAGMTWGEWY